MQQGCVSRAARPQWSGVRANAGAAMCLAHRHGEVSRGYSVWSVLAPHFPFRHPPMADRRVGGGSSARGVARQSLVVGPSAVRGSVVRVGVVLDVQSVAVLLVVVRVVNLAALFAHVVVPGAIVLVGFGVLGIVILCIVVVVVRSSSASSASSSSLSSSSSSPSSFSFHPLRRRCHRDSLPRTRCLCRPRQDPTIAERCGRGPVRSRGLSCVETHLSPLALFRSLPPTFFRIPIGSRIFPKPLPGRPLLPVARCSAHFLVVCGS